MILYLSCGDDTDEFLCPRLGRQSRHLLVVQAPGDVSRGLCLLRERCDPLEGGGSGTKKLRPAVSKGPPAGE